MLATIWTIVAAAIVWQDPPAPPDIAVELPGTTLIFPYEMPEVEIASAVDTFVRANPLSLQTTEKQPDLTNPFLQYMPEPEIRVGAASLSRSALLAEGFRRGLMSTASQVSKGASQARRVWTGRIGSSAGLILGPPLLLLLLGAALVWVAAGFAPAKR